MKTPKKRRMAIYIILEISENFGFRWPHIFIYISPYPSVESVKVREISGNPKSDSVCNSLALTQLRFAVWDVNNLWFFFRGPQAELGPSIRSGLVWVGGWCGEILQSICNFQFFIFQLSFWMSRGYKMIKTVKWTGFETTCVRKTDPKIQKSKIFFRSEYFPTPTGI